MLAYFYTWDSTVCTSFSSWNVKRVYFHRETVKGTFLSSWFVIQYPPCTPPKLKPRGLSHHYAPDLSRPLYTSYDETHIDQIVRGPDMEKVNLSGDFGQPIWGHLRVSKTWIKMLDDYNLPPEVVMAVLIIALLLKRWQRTSLWVTRSCLMKLT